MVPKTIVYDTLGPTLENYVPNNLCIIEKELHLLFVNYNVSQNFPNSLLWLLQIKILNILKILEH